METYLQNGSKVTINIPFTYTIGETGYFSGEELKNIDDCKNEVLLELESQSFSSSNIFLTVE